MNLRWDEMAFLRVEEVESFHRDGLRHGGGEPTVLDRGKLIGAVESVRNGYFDSVAEIASAYAFRITEAHAFADGNKRAAFLASWHFVKMNVFEPRPPNVPLGLERAIVLVACGGATESLLVPVFIAAMGGDVGVEP